jgi:WhiB family transcriptional regulator, redox-sensing transcriptional regulator
MSKWSKARCIGEDTKTFFDHEDTRGPKRALMVNAARRFCQGCPIQRACLTFALENGEMFGIWGGLTANERARLTTETRHRIIGISIDRTSRVEGEQTGLVAS